MTCKEKVRCGRSPPWPPNGLRTVATSQRGEMGLQLLDQLLALDMVGVGFQSLVGQLEALLELAELEGQQASVEGRLEEMRPELHRCSEMGLRLLHVALAQLQDAEVAVALRMVRIHGNGDLEGMVGKAQVADTDGHLANVVPDVCHVVIVCEHQGPLETTEGQVVLARVEATKT